MISEEAISENYIKTKEILGRGKYGIIYLGYNKSTHQEVAIKEGLKDAKLGHETKVYEELLTKTETLQISGIPKLYDLVKNEKGKFLVLEVLGPDLETLFQKCGRKFSLSTTTLIALRMLELLEYVHSFSYSYIDVKPENFLFGLKVNNRRLYLVDFGITKKFIDEKGNHIPFNENYKWVIGTINYVSVYNHYGIESSRRDDLIALGYLLARFLKGTLPWEDHKPPASYSLREKKINVELELLRRKLREIEEKVFFADLPEEYIKFMDYGEELGYGNAPDYAYLKTLFCSLLKREKIQENDPFDWDHLK